MFAVALAARVIVMVGVWDLPIVRTPKLDSLEYVSWARRLAAGEAAWPIVSAHGPGYPYFLASLFVLGSGSLHTVLIAQAILGALTAVLVAAIGREWAGVRAGTIAGLVYAMYGPSVYIDTALVAEGLLLLLLTLALFMLRREPVTVARAAAAGVALGAAALVRPTALVVTAACAAWLIASPRRRRASVVLAGACLIVMAPALAKNWSATRTLGIQGYGGLNFYIGNSPRHTGRPMFRLGAGWEALNAEASRAGISDPSAQDRFYVGKTFADIGAEPVGFLKLLALKTLWLVQAEEVRDSHSYYFFVEQAPLLRALPNMAVLFPLACIGALAVARGRAWPSSLLWYYTAAASLTAILLVVGTRYRMPLVAAFALLAGIGIDCLLRIFVSSWRESLEYVLVVIVAVAASHTLSDPRNRNVAEEWAFTGSSLITERNLVDAEAAYRRALALDPNSALAWDGLGLAQYDAGRLADARQSLSRAQALDAESARPVFHAALVDERDGKLPDAVRGYERAAALSPDDAEITYHLGTALGMAGRVEQARDQIRRVVALNPSNGEAWLDLCLLSLDLHDVEAAAPALQRARELGAAPGRIEFAAQALARARPTSR